ncbi:ABC transporter substrate-binding protein [Vineibacter terrae]|uniref:ABC transporter substrate-binding protein n=1 Tax=Vineibacter terrae TaxID=2586908 RepID=UPI002E377044|nr:ABC transporter substrate-binding protein [Vineibacter terrae]HEX2891415.1 ABC transporter substrate-binding protein [Vineibacter terrae]
MLGRKGILIAAVCAWAGAASAEPKTNLLHQWASGSDAEAIAKLGEMFTAAGGKWEQTSIAGHTANTLAKLRANVVAGDAPPAVQLKGPEIAEWNATGMTATLDALAAKEGWDKVVAPELLPVMKPTGKWVAAPMNIHRINWLWGSPKAMKAAGIAELPKTWAEFNAACDKAVAAKLVCIAHYSRDWTDATIFEVVVYGQDIDLFRKAFVEGDTEAMRSPGMVKAFEQYRRMVSKYMDPAIASRDYPTAVSMFGKGEAVFMINGDWHIGVMTRSGLKQGDDYVCAQAPTDWGKPGFILNSDSVVFFKQKNPDYVAGQTLLASLILSPDFQKVFNKAKGSIPARLDIDLADFNPCQQMAQRDLQSSIKGGTLVRTMAHNMTVLQKYRGAMLEVITQFTNNPKTTAKQAAEQLAETVEAQK